MFLRLFKPFIAFNIILLISFSISVNTFIAIQNVNLLFYVFFHLTFIYFLFYHYHFSIYFVGLFYGVFFDVFLINSLGSHLFCFMILISMYVSLKKYLTFFSSYQISIVIFITLIGTLFAEACFAYLFENIYITSQNSIKYFIISMIIFIPSILFFNKLDKK